MARERTASGIVIITAWRECVKPCFSETWVDVYNIATLLSTSRTGAARQLTCFVASARINGALRTTENYAETNLKPPIVMCAQYQSCVVHSFHGQVAVVETHIFGGRDAFTQFS